MYKYNFIEHTADLAFQIAADSVVELFKGSAYAWKDAVVEQWEFKGKEYKHLKFHSNSLEILLVDFLNELNFLFNTKHWLFERLMKLEIHKNIDTFNLSAILVGNEIDFHIFPVKEEIKAVTFHQLEIFEENNVFTTVIVFDV